MADNTQRPIVIKRVRKSTAGHHGGAWKIAYADFVTAMMAFFLLMWLLGSVTRGDLQGISDYFRTPLQVSFSGGSGAGDATSIVKAGGTDLSRADDQQMRRGQMPPKKQTINAAVARAAVAREDGQRLKGLKSRVEEVIDLNPLLRQYRNQLLVDITSEGLRIQVVDELNRPMFDLGSAQLKPYARDILLALSPTLNGVPNAISLTGHTDAKPYASGERGYSNWELSADRANASRKVLVAGGIDEGKLKRVVGMSSAVLFDGNDPLSPVNRRIAIIVLTRQAEEALKKDSGGINKDNGGPGNEAGAAVTASTEPEKRNVYNR
ncbi:MAG TPA: flagellar motor protein MotB [Burkholderiales bacterium]|jgi:chemotaxis protein MotB|nr:flagellar motor protein MotB [Burkholderiales bacterium]